MMRRTFGEIVPMDLRDFATGTYYPTRCSRIVESMLAQRDRVMAVFARRGALVGGEGRRGGRQARGQH